MAEDLKESVKKIVRQKQLFSCMNATKWKELRSSMLDEMPFQPPFIVKYLFEDGCVDDLRQDVSYTGDWYYAYALDGEYFDASFAIEWIKVRPRYLKSRGALVEPEMISAESVFIELLKKYNIHYEEDDGAYIIYGYRCFSGEER